MQQVPPRSVVSSFSQKLKGPCENIRPRLLVSVFGSLARRLAIRGRSCVGLRGTAGVAGKSRRCNLAASRSVRIQLRSRVVGPFNQLPLVYKPEQEVVELASVCITSELTEEMINRFDRSKVRVGFLVLREKTKS